MRPAGVRDIYPLSPMQEGLLFQSLSQPDSRAYFVQMTYDVEGPLDFDAFERSWRFLFARHDILRTAFIHEDVRRPLQIVLEERQPPIAYHDVSDLSAEECRAFLEVCANGDREHGFDFQHEPLMRLMLFRVSETRHHLIWSYHHMLLDGWCLSVLHRELLEIYAAMCERRPPNLPPAPPYRSYIDWLQTQDRDAALAYWAERLRGCDRATRVPSVTAIDAPFDARTRLLELDPQKTRELLALATAIPVTLSTIVQTLWSVVLSAYNDSSDVVFGSVVSGRPAEVEGIEEMVGLFINTVPVRARVRPEMSFIDLARELQSAALEGAPYQSVPLADVLALTPAGRALFDHVVVFENYPVTSGRALQEDGLRFRFTGAHDVTHYDFTLVVIPGERLTFKLLYNASAYDDEEIERTVRDIETAIDGILAWPLAPLPCIFGVRRPQSPHSLEAKAATAVAALPHDAIEEQILHVWRDVLGHRDVGLADDFFSLGGHSLKAMQVVSRIHRALGVKLSVHDFLESPTIAGVAALVRAARPSPYAAIERTEEREYYELSHAQRRLWLLHRMKGEVAYNIPRASLFEGDLDVEAVRRAFAAMVERHEALRTAFVDVNGEPQQQIRDRVEIVIPEVDVSGEADPEAAARRIAEADALRPFDLAAPPLLRFTIIRLGARKHVLLLTMHHIIGDGWSLNVMHRELAALVQSPEALLPLRIRYKDFAAWQNNADFTADERYWLDKLHGMPQSLRLPYDLTPAEDERDFRGSTESVAISEETTAALKAFAARKGTTVSNVVLACFAAVLYASTRQEDFCVGVSIANRSDPDVETLIGFFVNILPLRIRASQTLTFDDLLGAVVRDAYEAFAHQDYPFDLLVQKMNPGRVTNRQPLLNIVYGFQNFADVAIDIRVDAGADASESGVSRDFPISFQTSKFDLCLFVSDLRETMLLELEFDTGLFVAPTIRRLLRAIDRCIGRACAGNVESLGGLELLDDDEEKALLPLMRAMNETATDYPRDATVHQLFSEVAAKTPNAIAVVFEGSTLTYAELERRSNRLAAFLVDAGVQREDFVAVLLDRSLDVVVALLAILKAGAAYVPISRDMPHERLRYVLDDTRARMLITEKQSIGMANRLQWDCRALDAFLCIDCDDVHAVIETSGGIMATEVWDYIAAEAFDDISGGGWKSSYTGEWLSREVMDEYGDNIAAKLAPLVGPQSRILEIGTASGISMFRLAPLVARYYGTDLSPGIIRWSEQEAQRRGLGDAIRLAPLAAHEIDRLGERGFDVIILNSVIECFSGHNYLRDVLRKAIDLLNDNGVLFLGNVWDQDLKPQFVESLLEFKRSHPIEGKHAKTDRTDELFVSRAFLEDLRFDFPEIASIEYSAMLGTADSELSRFGFDALVSIRKRAANAKPARRNKQQLDRSAIARCPEQPLPERGNARGLAYLMYTSGTSGQPKGVMVEHRSIIRLVRDTGYVHFGPGDRTLQAGALSFDASTFEIWGPLLGGGSVVLPRGTSFLQPADLRALIHGEGITAMFLTSSLFNQIVEDDLHVLDGLRTLLVGGEKVSARAFHLVHAALPALALKNGYGPTENTTFSTSFELREPIEGDIPIGRPIANSTAWVLDDQRRLVPFGMPGELYVGGDGLARGYWNDPELTRRKFVAHPFAPPGERLYRTGDLVRQHPDGNLEYIGRIDTQVKIRGYRIELEEIESALLQHDDVAAAAVAALDRRGEGRELFAFVSGNVDPDALREHLRARLPQYMIPSYFIRVEQFQLNANGKIDRGALPIPDPDQPTADVVPPSTDTEKRLASIWKRILLRRSVSVTDDFFDLGGHSLKVARLVSVMQKELDVEVPLTIVFRAPTIRELARYVDDARRFNLRLVDDILVPLNRIPLNRAQSGAPLFAFPPGSGYCLAYQQLAERLPFAFHGFGFIEDDARMDEYVRRIRATATGPYVLFGYSAGGKLAFRVAQELERAGESVSDLILLDCARYHRAVRFSDEDVQRAAAEFLGDVSSQILRDKAVARMRKYRTFLGTCVESGTIRANVHLITASDSQDFYDDERTLVASFGGWRELTTGAFTVYRGSGDHLGMLQPPHVAENAELLCTIVAPEAVTARREADGG